MAATLDRSRLIAYAARHLGDEGEDALQEALLRIWERYRDPDLLDHVGMVRRTLAHVVTDTVRKRNRRPAGLPLADWLPADWNVEEQALATVELEETLAFLDRVANRRFPAPEVVLLSLGWSVHELADWAGVPRETVKSAIFRQRAALWKGVRA